MDENGSRRQYAVARRVVQRSSALVVLKKPEDEFDPGRALAQRTVASSREESTRGRFTLSARPGSHVDGGVVMDVLHPRCCGLDVHKSSISACILLREAGRVRAFNLSLILRKVLGTGTPRGQKNRAGHAVSRLLRFVLFLMTRLSPVCRLTAAVGQRLGLSFRCRMLRHRSRNMSSSATDC
jgi:hypothetical protein